MRRVVEQVVAIATVCSLGCACEAPTNQARQERAAPVSASAPAAAAPVPISEPAAPAAPPAPVASTGEQEPGKRAAPEVEADAMPRTHEPRSPSDDRFIVREYVSPGGPAGVAPVPDYPARAAEEPDTEPGVTPSLTVEQNNNTTINNNFFAPYLYRQPRRRRDHTLPTEREQKPTRPLHPAVTTPVHPAVTTPVHP